MLRRRGFAMRAIFITHIVFPNKVQMRAGGINLWLVLLEIAYGRDNAASTWVPRCHPQLQGCGAPRPAQPLYPMQPMSRSL